VALRRPALASTPPPHVVVADHNALLLAAISTTSTRTLIATDRRALILTPPSPRLAIPASQRKQELSQLLHDGLTCADKTATNF
jgi:hypothetical protein